MARKHTNTAPKTSTDTSSRRKSTSSRKSTAAAPAVAAAPDTVAVAAPVIDITPVAAPIAAPVARTIARDELDVAIRREAYQIAERRGFRNGNPFEDWITAESAVQARLAADGITVA